MSLRDDRQSVVDKTQADGSQVITPADRSARFHQLQLEVSGPPSAGTLAVGLKTPGANKYVEVGTIDMTDGEDYLQIFEGFAESIRLAPAGFDAGLTWSAYVYSTDGVR